ncbi:hypothetical protein [uncultured Desulfobacter sp.]|nr:hypothetical protein [uncultured Desulfobacter sp.]
MTQIASKTEPKTTNSRIYFSKKSEQRFFFYMTLIMLAVGLVSRLI